MTARRKLRDHMRQLVEIRDIMGAMKNLALLETHKLGNLLVNQQVLVNDLETVAADFLAFFPWPDETAVEADCYVVFGAERGFCGDFNGTLLASLESALDTSTNPKLLVTVGSKMNLKMATDGRVAAFVEGADVAEEIIPVLNRLTIALGNLQSGPRPVNVHAVFHEASTGQVEIRRLMPPFEKTQPAAPEHACPPLINTGPGPFFSDLLDRYLFVALQEIAYTSLMAENLERIQHMTGAVRRLDETTQRLLRQYHMQRQEDITEEIEVILLNANREVT